MYTTVSDTTSLIHALQSAHAGDTILLQAGDYSTLKLYGMNFSTPVTITSADASNPAVMHGISLQNTSGLTFTHLDMQYEPTLANAATVSGSHNITFDSVEVAGSAANRVGTGILIRSSDHVAVTNSNIHDEGDGIAHLNSNYVTIANNSIHDMSNDGVRGGGSSNVTIDHNTFTNFHPAQYAHNDAIQFWTTNTTTSAHDLTITNNTFIRGDGSPVQGIFMGNELQIPYQNVTITGNAIVGGAYQGINLDDAQNAKVEHNFVEGYQDMGSWIQVLRSTGVTVDNNEATSFIIQSNNTNLTQFANVNLTAPAIGDLTAYDAWSQDASGSTSSGTVTVAPPTSTTPDPVVTTAPVVDTAPVVPAAPSGDFITGTAGNDTLIGSAGDDTLSGGLGGGADILKGGAGNDTYIVTGWHSYVVEAPGAGIDTVKTALNWYVLDNNVENLDLTANFFQRGYGNAGDNEIVGNSFSNWLFGMDGNDTLVSNGGADVMTGGTGHDTFVLGAMPTHGAATITDFTHGQDTLNLHGLLGAYHGTNPVADGWVKFATAGETTTVYVDPDGPSGGSGFVAVAKLLNVTSMAASDWIF